MRPQCLLHSLRVHGMTTRKRPTWRGLSLVALVAIGLGARACGGADFTKGGSGTGGTGGLPPGGQRCGSPEDCDDGDPCTLDACGADGLCSSAAKCAPGLVCCDGACGDCCGDASCDDGIACTADACVGYFCSSAPGACGANEYCSIPRGGCVPLETCGNGQSCDDGDACTTDACDGAYCTHTFCAEGGRCCEGQPALGCNTCCSNAECDDDNPCTVDRCTELGCLHEQKACAAGTKCCRSTGQCAACCFENECDDAIACTDDACAGGACVNAPVNAACPPGEVCLPDQDGCQSATECETAADCVTTDPCLPLDCADGQCVPTTLACPGETRCCPNAPLGTDPCRACCSEETAPTDCSAAPPCVTVGCNDDGTCRYTPDDAQCATTTGQPLCDPIVGCVDCVDATDCAGGTPHPCFLDACEDHRCTRTQIYCTGSEVEFLCQECCTADDCTGAGGVAVCCGGTCCNGTCDVNGTCIGINGG